MKFFPEIFVVFLFLFLFSTTTIFADTQDIVINEIAWMGTETSHYDEWIELYNPSQNKVNLKGWLIQTKDGTPEIKLEGKIPAGGFFVLERTNEETLPKIKADQIYKGGLENKGEKLTLYNPKGEVVDEVNCSSGWFSGDKENKKTMERKDVSLPGNNSKNWQTSREKGGTPKKENSKGTENNFLQNNNKSASVSKSIPKSFTASVIFFIALVSSIFSALILFLIKRKFNFVCKNKKKKLK